MPFRYATLVTPSGAVSEDRVGVIERDDLLVVYVADGAGGLAGGAAASALFEEHAVSFASPFNQQDRELLVRFPFGVTDITLRQKGIGETTGVIIVVSAAEGIIGASAGDSEAWVVSGDRFDDLTAGQPRKRLGSGKSVFGVDPVMFRRSSFTGALVVGTDGLFKYASPHRVSSLALLPPEEACRELTNAVRLQSGALHDDVGIVVVHA